MKKSLLVQLNLCPHAESAVWLQKTERPKNIDKTVLNAGRRMSVSGDKLYSVNGQVIETGFDHLQKVVKASSVALNSGIIVASDSEPPANQSEEPAPVASTSGIIVASASKPPANQPEEPVMKKPRLVVDSSAAVKPQNARLQLHNTFNPFLRLAQQPFAPAKRARAQSVDAYSGEPPAPMDFSGPLFPYSNKLIRRRLSQEGASMLGTVVEDGNTSK